MSFWRNLQRVLKNPWDKHSSIGEKRLADAYQRVFETQSASDEDREIVLADLAEYTGFYKITAPGDLELLQFANGQRAVFARIFQYLRMSDADLKRLEEAALHEAQVHYDEDI
ncbi:MAG: hypothetical protein QNJ62_06230 [Methyloceanibacter sp.]|nr:hypothetical protein [Methyloceanibacter sp.]